MLLHLVTPEQISLICALQRRGYACMFLSSVQYSISHKERDNNSNTPTFLYNKLFFSTMVFARGAFQAWPEELMSWNSLLAVRQHRADALWGDFLLGYHWLGGCDPKRKANSSAAGFTLPSSLRAALAFPGGHGWDFRPGCDRDELSPTRDLNTGKTLPDGRGYTVYQQYLPGAHLKDSPQAPVPGKGRQTAALPIAP